MKTSSDDVYFISFAANFTFLSISSSQLQNSNITLVFQDEAWRLFVVMESTMTEFEENVSFDIDDPDFAPSNLPNSNAYHAVQFSDIMFDVNKCEYNHFSDIVTDVQIVNGPIAFLKYLSIRQAKGNFVSQCVLHH